MGLFHKEVFEYITIFKSRIYVKNKLFQQFPWGFGMSVLVLAGTTIALEVS